MLSFCLRIKGSGALQNFVGAFRPGSNKCATIYGFGAYITPLARRNFLLSKSADSPFVGISL